MGITEFDLQPLKQIKVPAEYENDVQFYTEAIMKQHEKKRQRLLIEYNELLNFKQVESPKDPKSTVQFEKQLDVENSKINEKLIKVKKISQELREQQLLLYSQKEQLIESRRKQISSEREFRAYQKEILETSRMEQVYRNRAKIQRLEQDKQQKRKMSYDARLQKLKSRLYETIARHQKSVEDRKLQDKERLRKLEESLEKANSKKSSNIIEIKRKGLLEKLKLEDVLFNRERQWHAKQSRLLEKLQIKTEVVRLNQSEPKKKPYPFPKFLSHKDQRKENSIYITRFASEIVDSRLNYQSCARPKTKYKQINLLKLIICFYITDMDYLTQDEVGGIVAKGLAALYLERPQFPIDYLAKWLLTYSELLKKQKTREDRQHVKETKIKEFKVLTEQLAYLQEESLRLENQQKEKHEQFLESIKQAKYHDEFLGDVFCDYVAKRFRVNSYVCELDFPKKEIDLNQEDDENAHINLEGTKLLTYIYADQNSKFLIGQNLLPETGVTYDALKEPQPDENGEVIQTNIIYVQNVVKEPRIVFHKWPKLGAYYAIPLTYQSCLYEQSFDQGIEQRQQYLILKENQDKERSTKEAEFEERLESEDPAIIEQEKQAYLASLEPLLEPSFAQQKKEYVFCIDTLGQDREIPENHRQEIFDLVNLLIKQWELQEIQSMKADVELQLLYQSNLGAPFKEVLENWTIEEEQYIDSHSEKLAELKENEKLLAYETDCLRLERLREKLSDKEFIQPLLNLSNCRIIKFNTIIQAGLYLIGANKSDINLPDNNRLNIRKLVLDENLIQSIVAYNHKGPKPEPQYKWCYVDRVQKRVEKIEQEQVDAYNLILGRLLKFLQLTCRLRKLDIEIRRENIANKRKQIEQLKEEAQKLLEQKELALREHKEQLTPEDLEEFNQEEWDANFDSEHPMPEIPENPVDEIDDDCIMEPPPQ
ncbi:unnamed protein product (macronuclear) [Paramecium tetraurelia]|uniref:Uncharacterized protein n=1 Tax=Paramecium tetraurelia TaxID=5888 RepID=A0D6D2_PARTE|nr:uncharacterized protein GSPATT00001640001 [Paramecium tetraurelia]CAK78599.1 unnamed protein product [Paramecium tetraurelia]|eukprot:XP_001445996.1 hypothetical protein (macronuclear) [Paramecium tetraurelia strain d4-2]